MRFEIRRKKKTMFFFNKRNKQIPQAVLRCDNTNLAPFATCTLYLQPVPYTTVSTLSTTKNANMSLFLFVFRLLLLLFVVFFMTRLCFSSALLGDKLFLKYAMKKSI